MASFFKADLPEDEGQWEGTEITEELGTPGEHSDRFWRKGPYGIEADSDGMYEAYVLVGDTPFKVGDGFGSFAEAVGFLTNSMKEKTVPDSPEEKSEQEAAEESEGEVAPDSRTEKSCDRTKVGPEATTTIGKSADFAKSEQDVSHETGAEVKRPREVFDDDVDGDIGSARRMSDSPDQSAFGKSFREMMHERNGDGSTMYGDTSGFGKADLEEASRTTSRDRRVIRNTGRVDGNLKRMRDQQRPKDSNGSQKQTGVTNRFHIDGTPREELTKDRHAMENQEDRLVSEEDDGIPTHDHPPGERAKDNVYAADQADSILHRRDNYDDGSVDGYSPRVGHDNIIGHSGWSQMGRGKGGRKDKGTGGRAYQNEQKRQRRKAADERERERRELYTTTGADKELRRKTWQDRNPQDSSEQTSVINPWTGGEMPREQLDPNERGPADMEARYNAFLVQGDDLATDYANWQNAPEAKAPAVVEDGELDEIDEVYADEVTDPGRLAKKVKGGAFRSSADPPGESFKDMMAFRKNLGYREGPGERRLPSQTAEGDFIPDARYPNRDQRAVKRRMPGSPPPDKVPDDRPTNDETHEERKDASDALRKEGEAMGLSGADLDDYVKVGGMGAMPKRGKHAARKLNDDGSLAQKPPNPPSEMKHERDFRLYYQTLRGQDNKPMARAPEPRSKLDQRREDLDRHMENMLYTSRNGRNAQADTKYFEDGMAKLKNAGISLPDSPDRYIGWRRRQNDPRVQRLTDGLWDASFAYVPEGESRNESWLYELEKYNRDLAKKKQQEEAGKNGDSFKSSSDDPSGVSFKDMLDFKKATQESSRGYPYGGAPISGTHVFRELYRTVSMGQGKDGDLASPYDPEIHKTDSTPRKL